MPDIRHVVVLMMENRSFDSMLGRLPHPDPDFDGLTGTESNMWQGAPVGVWSASGTGRSVMKMPDPEPHQRFTDVREQLFGRSDPPPGAEPDMSGFVANYMRDPAGRDPRAVMHGFKRDQVPVISELALKFGVSDRWHASTPNQTWPNRFFAHAGTAAGKLDNRDYNYRFTQTTIFNRMTEKGRTWRIYYGDIAHAKVLRSLWGLPDNFHPFNPDFLDDARSGNLPNYSFIEPRYFSLPLHGPPQDQHPPHNVALGERLIARCYDALRTGPGWERTLFIITYDENGGIYDHVPPPAAVPPDDMRSPLFGFDRFGVRVPAVIVSPWIPAGSLVRPPDGSLYPFDHTSIIATLRELYSLGPPLTRRDEAAPHLLDALSLPAPTNGGARRTIMPTATMTAAETRIIDERPPNDMQRGLAEAAMHLPAGAAGVPDDVDLAPASELEVLAETGIRPLATVREAREQALEGVRRFLRGPGLADPFSEE
jgi:phospholipase C